MVYVHVNEKMLHKVRYKEATEQHWHGEPRESYWLRIIHVTKVNQTRHFSKSYDDHSMSHWSTINCDCDCLQKAKQEANWRKGVGFNLFYRSARLFTNLYKNVLNANCNLALKHCVVKHMELYFLNWWFVLLFWLLVWFLYNRTASHTRKPIFNTVAPHSQ